MDPPALPRRFVQGFTNTAAVGIRAENGRQALDVVGVQVAEHDRREPVDAEPVEAAAQRTRIRAGVDENAAGRASSRG